MRVWFQLFHCLKFFHQTSDLSDSVALIGKLLKQGATLAMGKMAA